MGKGLQLETYIDDSFLLDYSLKLIKIEEGVILVVVVENQIG
jgi:hypothetical protein